MNSETEVSYPALFSRLFFSSFVSIREDSTSSFRVTEQDNLQMMNMLMIMLVMMVVLMMMMMILPRTTNLYIPHCP